MNKVKYIILGTGFFLCFLFIAEDLSADYLAQSQLLTRRRKRRRRRSKGRKIGRTCPPGTIKKIERKRGRKKISCVREGEPEKDITGRVPPISGGVVSDIIFGRGQKGCPGTSMAETNTFKAEGVEELRCYESDVDIKLHKDTQLNGIRLYTLPVVEKKLGEKLYEKLALYIKAKGNRQIAERFAQAGLQGYKDDLIDSGIVGEAHPIKGIIDLNDMTKEEFYLRLQAFFDDADVFEKPFSNYSNKDYFKPRNLQQ